MSGGQVREDVQDTHVLGIGDVQLNGRSARGKTQLGVRIHGYRVIGMFLFFFPSLDFRLFIFAPVRVSPAPVASHHYLLGLDSGGDTSLEKQLCSCRPILSVLSQCIHPLSHLLGEQGQLFLVVK